MESEIEGESQIEQSVLDPLNSKPALPEPETWRIR